MARRNLLIVDIFEDNQYGYFYETFSTLKLDELRLAFQRAPKDLTLIIFGKKYKINKLIISDISPFIGNFINGEPNIKELNLDMYFENSEDKNADTAENLNLIDETFQKFFDVINGSRQKFDIRKEQKFLVKISRILCITLPSHLIVNQKRDYYDNTQTFSGSVFEIEMSSYSILDFFSSCPATFSLKFNDNESQINPIILTLSDILYEEFQKDPCMKTYMFELDNSKNELAPIIDFLSVKSMILTTNNIDIILQAAETMQIQPIIKIANLLKKKFEESQIIYDKEEEKVNNLIDIQDLLFNLNEHDFDQNLSNLISSGCFNSIENIKEFISNLCNSIMYRPTKRKLYVKLISQLKQNELLEKLNNNNFFINFLVKYSISLSRESILICPLIYELYENEKIIDKKFLTKLIFKESGCIENLNNKKIQLNERKFVPTYSLIWFLPEMEEEYPIIFDLIKHWDLNCIFGQTFSIIKLELSEFRRDNWSVFKKNRALMTNPDPFAVVIANDDSEQLTIMSTKISFDFSVKIKMCLFENIEELTLIDYAARHGSIKCFKYMLLNGASIRNSTYNNAIIGGSSEIIRIIDNEIGNSILTDINGPNEIHTLKQNVGLFFIPYGSYQMSNILTSVMYKIFNYHFNILIQLETVLVSCIIYHRDEVFEWLMNKHLLDGKTLTLALCSIVAIAYNNIKVLMLIVDSGLFIHSDSKNYDNLLKILIQKAAANGFSEIIDMVVSLYGEGLIDYDVIENHQFMRYSPLHNLYGHDLDSKGLTLFAEAASFGSIKILKSFIKSFCKMSSVDIIYTVSNSIYNGNFDFADLVIETQILNTDEEVKEIEHEEATTTNSVSDNNNDKSNTSDASNTDNINNNNNNSVNNNNNVNNNASVNNNDDNVNNNSSVNNDNDSNDVSVNNGACDGVNISVSGINLDGGDAVVGSEKSCCEIVRMHFVDVTKSVFKEWFLNAIKSCSSNNVEFIENLITKIESYNLKQGKEQTISYYIDKDLISSALLTATTYNDQNFFSWIVNRFHADITSDKLEECLTRASSYGYITIINYCLTTLSYLSDANTQPRNEELIDVKKPIFLNEKKIHIKIKTAKKTIENAARYGHHEVILFLIDKIPSLFTQFIKNAFKIALSQSRSLTCKALLTNMTFQPTPDLLILSIKSNSIEVVTKILELNHTSEFLNSYSSEGTCLTIASSSSSIEIIQFLVDNYSDFIDPNIRDSNGNTALICAALKQRFDVIQFLCEKFQNRLEMWQFNALVPAFFSIMNLLKEQKKNNSKISMDDNFFNVFNPQENDIKIQKTSTNDIDLCRFLLNMFNNPSSSSSSLSSFELDWNYLYNDMTALMIAAEKNNLSLLQFLLGLDEIDVNARNVRNGDTALHIAAMCDNELVVEILVNDKRIEIGIENKIGESVLIKSIIPNEMRMNFNQQINRSTSVINKIISSPYFSHQMSQEQIGEALVCSMYTTNIAIFNTLMRIPSINVNHVARCITYIDSNMSHLMLKRNWKDDVLTLASFYSDENADFLAPILNHNTFDVAKCNVLKAAFFSVNKDMNTIFQPLLNLLNGNVNIIDQESRISLLNVSILSCSSAITPLILTNPNFDKEKSDIDNAITWDFSMYNTENSLVVNAKYGHAQNQNQNQNAPRNNQENENQEIENQENENQENENQENENQENENQEIENQEIEKENKENNNESENEIGHILNENENNDNENDQIENGEKVDQNEGSFVVNDNVNNINNNNDSNNNDDDENSNDQAIVTKSGAVLTKSDDEINKDLKIKYFKTLMVPQAQYYNMYFENRTSERVFGTGSVLKLSLHSRTSFENLLEYQSRLDPNKIDKYGNSVFSYSSFISPLAVDALQRLKEADVNQQNKLNGMTTLMYACIFQPSSIQILLENEKIDVNIEDFEGKTAFDHIVEKYDLDVDDDFERPKTREEFKEWIEQIQDYLFSRVYQKPNNQWNY